MLDGITAPMAIGVMVALAVVGDRASKKRKKAFWERYGSFEGFRSQVDEEKIQRVRREQGDVVAIKVVRQTYPYVPLLLAKRYVEELPA
ncbi:hypothetical protein ACIQMV_17610 [Streptomyces sp. NPDC091412]|uniref:hypothetical protein n=1 Tax=unclassified Streptomyces TaxID=2593676 RepID=UPI0011430A2F|nr:hypothetical protein [Streptomyces sp. 6-11-2]GED85905.1 hypothetical protein TNCT6_29900 [Streptomyces sp. 6-11-2]